MTLTKITIGPTGSTNRVKCNGYIETTYIKTASKDDEWEPIPIFNNRSILTVIKGDYNYFNNSYANCNDISQVPGHAIRNSIIFLSQ